MAEEKSVWMGTPSQVVNLGAFILCGILFFLVIPLFIMLWKWLVVKTTKYELSTERLRTQTGIFNKKTDELELYRVRDYQLEQPFFLRMFSLGNIVLETSDRSHPHVVIQAISKPEGVLDQLREHVEECRTRKQVREVDFE